MADDTNTVQHTLSDVQAQVALLTDAKDAAVALLASLAEKLAATQFDPAQVQAIYNDLVANKDALAAAVLANTPAAPAPPATQ